MALLVRLLTVLAIAIVLFDPQVALAQEQKQPTAIGSGGAAATVDLAGTQAAIQTLRQGGNAVDAAVAAAGVLGVTEPFSCGIGGGGFMVIRTSKGKITTIDGREESPRTMRPDSFWENGAPLAFNEASLQRPVGRHPRHARHLGARPGPLRHLVARPRAAARHPRGARRLHRRPDLLRPDHAQHRLVQRHPLDGRDLPRPRRHAARRRLDAPEPRPRAHLPAAGERGSGRVLPRRAGERDGRRLAASAQGGRRQPRLAPGPDDDRRPAPLPRDRAQADPQRLPRPRHLGHGPAVERWLHRRRGAQHPRGLPGPRRRPRPGAPPPARVVALHVRRPQRLPGGPGLLQGAARRPPVRQLRGRAARADRRGARPPRARWPPATPTTTRRGRASRAAAAPRSATRASPPPTWSSRTARATSSRTRSRSSRPAATRLSCPATASS